ncbi:hypothetical protein GCM10009558_035600 [Virgisporangium aurantiacum]
MIRLKPADARRLWTLIEPIHDVTYFTPQSRAAFEAAGLRGFWRGYFAGRAAPLGPVGAAPVTAIFYVFAPHMVTRALPDVWTRAEPSAALAARLAELSQGNPLLLRELVDAARLRRNGGVWRAQGPLVVADSLPAAIAARLDRLPPDVRATAELVALAGAVPAGGLAATLPRCCADTSPVPAPPTARLMVTALTAAGLVNSPTRWWHWSYGDRFWAFASGAPHARYGPVPPTR